jgi:hypothetical protein
MLRIRRVGDLRLLYLPTHRLSYRQYRFNILRTMETGKPGEIEFRKFGTKLGGL